MPLYDSYKVLCMNGAAPDLDTDDIRAMLVKSTQTFDASDDFLDDVAADDNGRSADLTTKAISSTGVWDSDDTTLTATAAAASDAIVTYKYNASDAAAELIGYHPVSEFTPSASQEITVKWDAGANKIFAL